MDEKTMAAAQEYLNRKSRRTHPQGHTDNGGRWIPAHNEFQECCKFVRAPSRAWPWSLMTHCRTLAHVAHLYGVAEAEVRAAVKTIKAEKV